MERAFRSTERNFQQSKDTIKGLYFPVAIFIVIWEAKLLCRVSLTALTVAVRNLLSKIFFLGIILLPIFAEENNESKNIPTIFFFFGLRFFSFTNEHLPPHIHVRSADGKAKFNLLDGTMMEESSPHGQNLLLIDFLQAWIGMVVATIEENVSPTGRNSLLPIMLFTPSQSFRTSFRSLIICRAAQIHTFHLAAPMVAQTNSRIGMEHRSWG